MATMFQGYNVTRWSQMKNFITIEMRNPTAAVDATMLHTPRYEIHKDELCHSLTEMNNSSEKG